MPVFKTGPNNDREHRFRCFSGDVNGSLIVTSWRRSFSCVSSQNTLSRTQNLQAARHCHTEQFTGNSSESWSQVSWRGKTRAHRAVLLNPKVGFGCYAEPCPVSSLCRCLRRGQTQSGPHRSMGSHVWFSSKHPPMCRVPVTVATVYRDDLEVQVLHPRS